MVLLSAHVDLGAAFLDLGYVGDPLAGFLVDDGAEGVAAGGDLARGVEIGRAGGQAAEER
ncbi:MAG TPA: hypothetical protein VH877_31200 [Polyangia bacterium]|nr:hypothetical protein [Polyangia bacterium]